jgi:stage V sporulation protein AE
MFLDYLLVFVIGGLFCIIGQILVLKTKLKPTRILVTFLIAGAVFEFAGLYEYIVEVGKAGALVPISGFGAAVVEGVRQEIVKEGAIGMLTGGLKATAGGIGAAIFFSFFIGLIFDSKSKNK